MILQKSLFFADNEVRMLEELTSKCGSLEMEWPEAKNLPLFSELYKPSTTPPCKRSLVAYLRKLKPK